MTKGIEICDTCSHPSAVRISLHREPVNEGIKTAAASEASAKATLAEAEDRRRSLLLPLGLIALLMLALYLKLRQLERRG